MQEGTDAAALGSLRYIPPVTLSARLGMGSADPSRDAFPLGVYTTQPTPHTEGASSSSVVGCTKATRNTAIPQFVYFRLHDSPAAHGNSQPRDQIGRNQSALTKDLSNYVDYVYTPLRQVLADTALIYPQLAP